jgi:uncharacterized repeat protein (TIGR01451 family)
LITTTLLVLTLLPAISLGQKDKENTETAANPVPFISELSPVSTVPGGGDFTLTVRGTGFINGQSVIYWNGQALPDPTTCTAANPPQLASCSATVQADEISTAGTAGITIVNPNAAPLDGSSNVVFFPINTSVATVVTSQTDIAVGNLPGSIAVGDFNGDGKLDLAVANAGSDNLTILLGNGDGNFTATGSSPGTGNGPQSIGVGDFNGDGKLDLAVANYQSSNVTVLLGSGDGTFTPATSSPTVGCLPTSLAAGDFNGDGKLDLAVANSCSDSVTILLGNGDGNFTPTASSPSTGHIPYSLAVGDFNGDGKLDLAVANECGNGNCFPVGTGTVTILLGNGDGTFTATASSPSTGAGPESVSVGDFNGDGRLDLAVANTFGATVTILLGNGDGTFTPTTSSPSAGLIPYSLAVGDFNDDGKLDLAVVNEFGSTMTILLGDGDGTFTPNVSPGTGQNPLWVAVGDFNGDGRLDFVTSNGDSHSVSVLLQLHARDMTISKTHLGNFTQGQTGVTYTIIATNIGNLSTNGTVTVTDTLPTGLTATAMSGSGWTCTLGTLTCTRSDVLNGGSSYPPITLTVNVATNAPASVTNTATVAGGGESNTSNDTANDPTTILQLPTADSVTPNAATGPNQTFTLTYSVHDPGKSYTGLTWVFLRGNLEANGCFVRYLPGTNSLYLLSDSGSTWQGPLAPGSAGTLANSQCTLNGTGSSASGSGQTLTLVVSLSATTAFLVGTQQLTMAAQDSEGVASGWQDRGTWTPGADTPPTADSVTPNAASGPNQTFVLTYSAHNGRGYTDLNTTFARFYGLNSNANGCEVKYYLPLNLIFLANDAGTTFEGGLKAGTAGTLANSQCTVNLAGSSASGSGQTLTVTLSVSAKAAFTGSMPIYMAAIDSEDTKSGWQLRGTWNTVDTPPTADSVTPNASGGLNQTFALNYSVHNGLGYSDLAWVYVRGNLETNGCEVRYTPGSNGLYLLNDAATAWLGPLAPGSTGTLANSQCTVNGTGSSASGSGQTLTLNLSLSANATFVGTQQLTMQAEDNEGDRAAGRTGVPGRQRRTRLPPPTQ